MKHLTHLSFSVLFVCFVLPSSANAQYTLATLVSFSRDEYVTKGVIPNSLIADTSGNLYGTTVAGGGAATAPYDGIVFKLAAGTHAFTTLASFDGSNGGEPSGGLIFDGNGNLYGTTGGGTNNDGTLFEIAAGTGALTTVVTFNGTNGANPVGGLISDAHGNLYGATFSGGANNKGTLFEVAAGTHALSTLVTFNGFNGDDPAGSLVFDASGNLYGATEDGGGTNGNQYGIVFKLAAGTHAFSTLATFTFKGNIGAGPCGPLVVDASGNLFGTTEEGGSTLNNGNGYGTVFEIAAGTHALSTVVAFNGANGGDPAAGLISDANGNIYGTTKFGGDLTLDNGNGGGVVFELAADTHSLSTLANLPGWSDGQPVAGLVLDANGDLYGTTQNGGTGGYGTLFELSPVPEPSSLALAGFSLATVLLARVVQTARRNFRHRAIEVSKTDCVAEFEL